MRIWKYLIFAALVAAIPAILVSYVALQHNPQGEFADTFTGVWTADFYRLFFFSWAFAAVFVSPVAFGLFMSRSRED